MGTRATVAAADHATNTSHVGTHRLRNHYVITAGSGTVVDSNQARLISAAVTVTILRNMIILVNISSENIIPAIAAERSDLSGR